MIEKILTIFCEKSDSKHERALPTRTSYKTSTEVATHYSKWSPKCLDESKKALLSGIN